MDKFQAEDRLQTLNREYTEVCAHLGDQTFKIHLLQCEAENLTDRLEAISREAGECRKYLKEAGEL